MIGMIHRGSHKGPVHAQAGTGTRVGTPLIDVDESSVVTVQ